MSEAQKIDMALADMMAQLGVNARRAARQLTTASTDQKNTALQAAADELRADAANILAANCGVVASLPAATKCLQSACEFLRLRSSRLLEACLHRGWQCRVGYCLHAEIDVKGK